MSLLEQGSSVWATIPDSRGQNPKVRPVVILTPTSDIVPTELITVAAITTQIGEAPFSQTVRLPGDPAGHPVTKLKRECEVVCTRVYDVPLSNLQNERGRVPANLLLEILEKVGL